MATKLEEVNGALKTRSEAMVELLDKLDGETAPTAEQLKGWQDELTGLEGELKSLNLQKTDLERQEKLRGEARATIQDLSRPVRPHIHDGGEPGGHNGGNIKSAAAAFVDSDAYKAWLRQHAPTGRVPDNTSGRLPDGAPMALDTSIKTIITGLSTWESPADTSGSALVTPRFRGIVDEGIWQIPLGIADMVTHEQTDTDVIFYVKVDTGTAAALTVAEATAESDTSGQKPQGELTFVQGEAVVRTLAIWVPVTRQALSNSAQLRGVIERYLRYELQRELTRNIIDGDGSGQEFVGIQNLPDVLSQTAGADINSTARKAITNLLLNGRTSPTGWAMHPNDWERFDLEPDAELRYYMGGPREMGTPRLWGVPVRQSEFVTEGTPILGDWSRYIVADREQATLRVSDSHSNYFIRNLMALLDEMRAAGYCERDEAFVLVTLPAAS